MAANAEDDRHILEQSLPDFLHWMDRDPQRAWQEFYAFTWKLFQVYPPRIFASLTPEEREDLVAEIVLAFSEDDFRRLRGYEDRGRPFAAWLATSARHAALTEIRNGERWNRLQRKIVSGRSIGPDEDAHLRQLLVAVRECIREMGEKCRVLLEAAGDGLKPAEMPPLLGWPAGEGKKASDHLRSCRKALMELLRKRGIDPLGDVI